MKVNSLTNKNADWPTTLDNLHITPAALYFAGKIPSGPRVGIVGSRRPTSYGVSATRAIATGLAAAGATIVSGLALGVDSIAHQAALDVSGKTIAVLPSSLDYIYPRRHQNLAQRIIQSGSAIISEYPCEHKPRREDFIARNRLIAAFSEVLIITEATIKSGTSHTVNFALELGVDVAAVPGHIDSQLSKGAHNIIKNGGALVETADDVLQLLGLQSATATEHKPQLSPYEQKIVKQLQQKDHSIDELLNTINYRHDQLSSLVMGLEVRGIVARSSDGVYALRW